MSQVATDHLKFLVLLHLVQDSLSSWQDRQLQKFHWVFSIQRLLCLVHIRVDFLDQCTEQYHLHETRGLHTVGRTHGTTALFNVFLQVLHYLLELESYHRQSILLHWLLSRNRLSLAHHQCLVLFTPHLPAPGHCQLDHTAPDHTPRSWDRLDFRIHLRLHHLKRGLLLPNGIFLLTTKRVNRRCHFKLLTTLTYLTLFKISLVN